MAKKIIIIVALVYLFVSFFIVSKFEGGFLTHKVKEMRVRHEALTNIDAAFSDGRKILIEYTVSVYHIDNEVEINKPGQQKRFGVASLALRDLSFKVDLEGIRDRIPLEPSDFPIASMKVLDNGFQIVAGAEDIRKEQFKIPIVNGINNKFNGEIKRALYFDQAHGKYIFYFIFKGLSHFT